MFKYATLCVALCAPLFAHAASNPAELPPVVVTANPLGSSLFDLVSPVSVLGGKDLQLRRESTLGETISHLPGVSSTYFGPNASRPVIRGLDADRIRILQNGIGLLDVSALSPDHATTIDPLVVDSIEVVRGSAALLYGGSAVGGVVNVLDNRIPQEAISGFNGRVESRLGGAASERSSAAVLEGGNGRVAFHADVYKRETDDLKIPGFARSDRQRAVDANTVAQPHGRLPNSSSVSDGSALGASLTSDRGYLGLSHSNFNANYGIVAEKNVRIDMNSARWDVAGEVRELGTFVQGVKFKYGYTDYGHKELKDGKTETTFTNNGYETRIEATHARLGPFTGVFGMQLANVNFSALGEEAFVPKVETGAHALFLYEEATFGDVKLTFGGRSERTALDSAGGGKFGAAKTREFSAQSGAVGALYSLDQNMVLAANLSHTERAPSYAELFAKGPHVATSQYEVGDANLAKEQSHGADVQLRWRSGAHLASISGYTTRFRNYIGLFKNGATDTDSGLKEAEFRAVQARFQGFETEGKFRVAEGTGSLDLKLRGDYVRATNLNTGAPLPRISPLRLGAGLDYQIGNFGASLDVTCAAGQNRVAPGELRTSDHTLTDAALTWRIKARALNLKATLKGNNLFNQEARVHASPLKDIAPLPGRGLLVGLRGSF